MDRLALFNFRSLLFCLVISAAPLGDCAGDEAKSPASQIEPTGAVVELQTGFAFTEGPAAADDGTLFFTDIPNNTIHRVSPEGELGVFTDQSNHANGLWWVAGVDGSSDELLACEMDGAIVRYEIASGKRSVLTDRFDGKRYNACNDLVVDDQGGVYFTDPQFRAPEPLPQTVRGVYYLAPDGTVTRLTGDLAAPNGIGLSLDGKTLYVIPSMQQEMLAFDVTAPGKIANQRTFCELKQPAGKTGTGGDGMAMDVQGNLYITTNLGIQIFAPSGEFRGLVSFPQQPANVTFMGKDFKTMVVTARTALYTVSMPIAGSRRNMSR